MKRFDPFETVRSKMVEKLAAQGIGDRRTLDAMAQVPRELFVSPALRGKAYEDVRLPIGLGQTISAPSTVARMSALVDSPDKSRVLEIGAGSGYQAAVLGAMGYIVYSVERHAQLARQAAERIADLGLLNVSIKHFDGTYGWAANAPYRAIIVTAAGPEVPVPLLRQLEDVGRLVMPLARGAEQRLVAIEREGARLRETDHGVVDFVPLIGRYGFAADDAAKR